MLACVGNDDDLRAVTLGADGAFAGMKPGAIFVDHTTASAERGARAARRRRRGAGLGFLDAPVSGGQAGAENGAADHHVRRRRRREFAQRGADRRGLRANPAG